jgi:uncharacterized protein (TIGR02996 family)
MNDTINGLLDAMRANPKDLAPRLVYADVLDDLGYCADAAFVRRNCDVYSLPICHPERRAITSIPELKAAMAAGYIFPAGLVLPAEYAEIDESTPDLLVETDPPVGLRIWADRGLFRHVECDLKDWVRHADNMVRWHPIRSADVSSYSGSDALVVASAGSAGRRELTVVVPDAEPLGPISVPEGALGLRAAHFLLLDDRWPTVEIRLHLDEPIF